MLMGYDQLGESTEFMNRYSNSKIWKKKYLEQYFH